MPSCSGSAKCGQRSHASPTPSRSGVRLVGVGELRAVVRRAGATGHAEPVAVRVEARVARVTGPVGVAVALAGIRGERAGVARVADPVLVGVGLVGVPDGGTVVEAAGARREAGVTEAVAVAVGARIRDVGDLIGVVVGVDLDQVEHVVGRLGRAVRLRAERLAAAGEHAARAVVVRAVEAEAELRAGDRPADDLVVVRHAHPAGVVRVALVGVALEDVGRALEHVAREQVLGGLAAHVHDRAAHDVVEVLRLAGVLVIDRRRSRVLDHVARDHAVGAPEDVEALLPVADDLVLEHLRAHAARADVDAVLLAGGDVVALDAMVDRLAAVGVAGDLDSDGVALDPVRLELDPLAAAQPDATLEAADGAVLHRRVVHVVDADAVSPIPRWCPCRGSRGRRSRARRRRSCAARRGRSR